jgi:hypothetical protein
MVRGLLSGNIGESILPNLSRSNARKMAKERLLAVY